MALLRNLCTSLIVHERLVTTLPKAKELGPFAERAITLGKRALEPKRRGGASRPAIGLGLLPHRKHQPSARRRIQATQGASDRWRACAWISSSTSCCKVRG